MSTRIGLGTRCAPTIGCTINPVLHSLRWTLVALLATVVGLLALGDYTVAFDSQERSDRVYQGSWFYYDR